METFRITQSRRMCERVVLISATGRIDASGARQLRQMIDRVLTARNLSRLVVDLTRVDYLSPRGVGTLLRARDLSAQFAIDLRLVTTDGPADDALRKPWIVGRFRLSSDVDTACLLTAP